MNKVEMLTHSYKDNAKSFILRDILGILINNSVPFSDIIEIASFRVYPTDHGLGSLYLNEYTSKIQSDVALVLKAEPMYDTFDDYNKAIKSGEFDISINKLVSFYNKNGFISVNEYVRYDCGIAMIYANDLGTIIKNIILKQED